MSKFLFWKSFSKKDIIPLSLAYVELYAMLVGDAFISDSRIMNCISIFWSDISKSYALWLLSYLLLWGFAFYLLMRDSNRRKISWSRIVLCITSLPFGYIVFCTENKMYSFYLPIASYFLCSIISELTCLGVKDKVIATDFYKKGFVVDNSSLSDLENVQWGGYSANLVDRLLHTNVEVSSFAVALTGEWGTGKTTFLEMLRCELNKANVPFFSFNPWLSASSDMIVQDYFNTLKEKLDELGIHVERELDKYVNFLLKYTVPSFKEKVADLFNLNEDSNLGSLRSVITDALCYLDTPLFVLIDDVDRLQPKEILEILKLIRNTADFSKVIYVATFDKEYVVKSLNANGVVKADEFLKKIFQVELKFPRYERYLYNHSLFKEINEHIHVSDVRIKGALSNLEMSLDRKIFVGNYLSSFRDVKRFVNDFLLVVDYVVKQGLVDDFNIVDLFLIELLNYTDQDLYLKLKEGYREYLCVNDGILEYVERESTEVLDERSKKILKLLFPKDAKKQVNMINNEDRYYTYFSYRPYGYQMGITQFGYLLRASDTSSIVDTISKSNEGIFDKTVSLYYLMVDFDTDVASETELKNFIVILTEWTRINCNADKAYYRRLYPKVVVVNEKVSPVIRKELHDKLVSFFDEFKKKTKAYSVIQCVLCELVYQNKYVQPGKISIFTNDEIASLIHNNTIEFFNRVKPTVNQLLDDSRLYEFVVVSVDYTGNNLDYKKFPAKLLIEKDIIGYFSKTKSTNNYQLFFDKLCILPSPNFRDGQTPDDIILENKIKSIFVTVDFYKRFMKECFVYKNKDTLEGYFKANKIVS